MSPAVLQEGPYRFYFYSHERGERPHIQVVRDDRTAKFWIQPVALAFNFGFGRFEARRIEAIVREHQAEFLEAWYEFFRT